MIGPRVSVIVCAYNAEGTVGDCLDSLFRQTCRDFETIVVDDGSTDATAAVVDRLSADRSSVRLVRTAHEGLAGARNHGVAEASGEFLGFVDADDLAEPRMVERMLASADATSADIVVCEVRYADFGTGTTLHTSREGDPSLYGGSLLDRPGLLAALGGGVCNKLVRRSLFEESGLEFPPGRFFEDLWVAYRLCGEARLIAKVDEPLYVYRVGRPGSIVETYDDRYLDIADALAVTNDYFIAKGDFEVLRDDLLAVNYTHLIFGRYTNLLLSGPRDLRHRYLAKAFAHMDRYFPGWRHSGAVRTTSGRYAKRVVLTHRRLLEAYLGLKARPTGC